MNMTIEFGAAHPWNHDRKALLAEAVYIDLNFSKAIAQKEDWRRK